MPFVPEITDAAGTVGGEVSARVQSERISQARARLDFSAGRLVFGAAREPLSLEYERATLDVDTAESALNARFAMALAGADHVHAEVTLPNFRGRAESEDQPLAGTLTARLNDLDFASVLFPVLEEPRGSVELDLTLAGTLAQPQARGSARLADGSVALPDLGIRLQSLNVELSAEAAGLRFAADARSGEGVARLTGRMDWPQSPTTWRADVTARGDRFEVVNRPEAWVLASPNLELRVQNRRIEISNELLIPQARIEPRPLSDAVAVSSDVVLINAPAEVGQTQAPDWELSGRARLVLGERVMFKGFGLNGRVTGSISLSEDAGKITTATGELNILDGKYKAYGQELIVERGRLMFAGGPLDNPGIDARAVRRAGEVTAGVLVRGTLKDPRLTLFSEPAMAQTDALSYLLVGQPLDQASTAQGRLLAGAATALKFTGGDALARTIGSKFGFEEVGIETGSTPEQASLVIGKYLSPRLYVNYSIGLLEEVDLLRLRYQLNRHWTLQTESGSSSAADLLYTIER